MSHLQGNIGCALLILEVLGKVSPKKVKNKWTGCSFYNPPPPYSEGEGYLNFLNCLDMEKIREQKHQKKHSLPTILLEI